jgi:hypothetical protein
MRGLAILTDVIDCLWWWCCNSISWGWSAKAAEFSGGRFSFSEPAANDDYHRFHMYYVQIHRVQGFGHYKGIIPASLVVVCGFMKVLI